MSEEINENEHEEDSFLKSLKEELETLFIPSTSDVADLLSPKGQFITRDTVVLSQGKNYHLI